MLATEGGSSNKSKTKICNTNNKCKTISVA